MNGLCHLCARPSGLRTLLGHETCDQCLDSLTQQCHRDLAVAAIEQSVRDAAGVYGWSSTLDLINNTVRSLRLEQVILQADAGASWPAIAKATAMSEASVEDILTFEAAA